MNKENRVSDELLPCPFCGGTAKLSNYRVAEDTMGCHVACTKCLVQTDVFEDAYTPFEQAIRAWNTRSKPVSSGVEPTIDSPTVVIGYTNWRGEYGEREIVPMRPWFGSTEWHPEPQWFLKAWDVEKDAERDFAIKDIGFNSPKPKAVTEEMVERAAKAEYRRVMFPTIMEEHRERVLEEKWRFYEADARRWLEAAMKEA